ncbi:MAG: hypothetical protein EON58_00640 [Alphaproteobacteria bacterium]|nr:MAG: hypothetical protein EON58_00640 [Alphaproteobacteria bacterium]
MSINYNLSKPIKQVKINNNFEKGCMIMANEVPKINIVNGFHVIEAAATCFKVYTYDLQIGGEFNSFKEAADFANSLGRGLPPRAR